MLIATADASASVGIQVKTNQGSRKEWLMDKKAEESAMENLLYVFVNLNGTTGTPTYHVVPSQVVADYICKSHQEWLTGTPVRGKERKDTSMRVFEDPSGEYLGKWEVLSSLLRNKTA